MPMLKQTLTTSRQPSPEPEWVDENASLRAALAARMQQEQAPMFSPEESARRVAQNRREYEAGLLGLLSGDQGMGNVGGALLKNSLAGRQPTVTERGTVDPLTGKFTYSPDYLRMQQQAQLDKLDAASATSRADFLKRREAAQDRRDLQQERYGMMAALGLGGGGDKVGAFQPYGITPDGKQVVTNTKSGLNYLIDLKPDGTPAYTPYMGTATPKATFEKNVATATEGLQSAARADALLNKVASNPEAFGFTGAAISALPGGAQGYAAIAAGLTPQQMQMRADVLRAAAMEVSNLYGAAQSAGESARAATFIPDSKDGPEAIMSKLAAARDWARSSATMHGPAVVNAATGRSSGAVNQPAAAASNPHAGFSIVRDK